MSAQPVDVDPDGERSRVAAFRHVAVVTPLGAAMRDRRISGQQLARAVGVHENSVYAWRAGKALPQDALAHRVARALELPAAQLFPHLAVPAATPAPVPTREPRPAPQPVASPVEARPVLLSIRRAQPAPKHLDPREFTRRLAQLMAARRVDVTRLSQASKVPVAALRGWLAGDPTAPDPKAASRLASALGTSADQLTGDGTPTLLAVALEQRGWDYRRLARAIGATDKTVNAWINGTRTPQYHAADAAAAALGRDVADLFDVAHPPDPAPLPEPGVEPGGGGRGLPTVDQVLAVPATGRDDWAGDAACAAPDQDPDAWWPAPNDPAEQARATCGGCPVQGDCRDNYLESRDTPDSRAGIWAGLPGGQLRVLARDRAAAAAPRREPGADRAVDAAADTGIARAPRPSSAPTTPALDEARRGGHLEPAPGAEGRAKPIRPAPAAAPSSPEPHAEPASAHAVAADAARTARDDDAPATERAAEQTMAAGPARQPVAAASGMAP